MSVTSTPIVMNPILSVSQAVRFVCAHRDTASTPLRNHLSQVSFISTSSGTCTQWSMVWAMRYWYYAHIREIDSLNGLAQISREVRSICCCFYLNPLSTSFLCKYSKTCVKRPLKNRQNKDINDKWYLMKVKSIAECSPRSILQYVWHALSDNYSWNPIVGPFESSRFTQVCGLWLWYFLIILTYHFLL